MAVITEHSCLYFVRWHCWITLRLSGLSFDHLSISAYWSFILSSFLCMDRISIHSLSLLLEILVVPVFTVSASKASDWSVIMLTLSLKVTWDSSDESCPFLCWLYELRIPSPYCAGLRVGFALVFFFFFFICWGLALFRFLVNLIRM